MARKPLASQYAPLYFTPRWHVGHLVFQGGNPRLPMASMSGGGFLPQRDLAGHEQPSWQPYATPVSSLFAGGVLPSRPNFLQPLLGSNTTTQF
jgi:hypothetical protein